MERKDSAGNCIDGEAASWKPDFGVVRATIDFARKIGRLNAERLTGLPEAKDEGVDRMRDTGGEGRGKSSANQ